MAFQDLFFAFGRKFLLNTAGILAYFALYVILRLFRQYLERRDLKD
ncbi:MAG: hypothetical protein ACW99A_15515 [Candidatus Kariarchaeaceae archaeon]